MAANVRHRLPLLALLSASCLLALPQVTSGAALTQAPAPAPAPDTTPAPVPGAPFTAEKLAELVPATVYFQGRTAPVQLRNSGGASLSDGAILWAAMVDSSGYASSVQERYQFYLVTEGALHVGNASIPAGAYGGGFLGDHFLLMDLGGHTIAQGPIQNDANLLRPRPLQVVADSPKSVKLYLGRRWVLLKADSRAETR